MNAYENKKTPAELLAEECDGLQNEPGVACDACPTTTEEAEQYQLDVFNGWGQMLERSMAKTVVAYECEGLANEPGMLIDTYPVTGEALERFQAKVFDGWGQVIKDGHILASDCVGLENEPGVLIDKYPVGGVEATLKHLDDMFLAWCGEEPAKVTINRKRVEDGGNLGYIIYEESAFLELPLEEQANLKKTLGRFCIVVPDGFFRWLDTDKYPTNIAPHAELFIAQMGDRYLIDANSGEGHVLQRIGESMKTLTTADYWVTDIGDVKLASMIDSFAADIAKVLAAIPFTASAKNGPGRPKKADEPQPNTPEYVEKERNKVLGRYHKILEDRYEDYAGYNAERILKKVKKIMAGRPVVMNDLERTGSLVPMRNGVYDLRTGRFRSAQPDDYISVWAPTTYDPNARNKNVEKFIDQFTCGREDLKDFLAQVLGVSLDLNMITRTLCELWGQTTSNGKSTIVKALVKCLGKGEENGLAQVLSNKAIGMPATASDDSAPTPSLGMIRDARILFASEPDKGMKVNWALVKQLTSGDTFQSRQLYKEMKNRPARATLIIDTNHALRVTDPTVFARGTIQVLPCDFKVTPKNKDDKIDEKLSTESAKSTIMNFILNGYKSFVKNGKQFCNPTCVQAALAKNKEQSDRIGCFVKENYVVGQSLTKKVALYPMWEEYRKWCQDNGYEHPEVYKTFCAYFESNERVYPKGELHNQMAICGLIKLSSSEEIHQIVTGDPVDWYIGEFMVEESQNDGQQLDMDGQAEPVKTVKLETIHSDYRRKVADAGGQALEFWPFYGELMGRRWNITMGNPGDTSSITATGWHIASKAELKAKQEAKVEARAAEIRRDVKSTLEKMNAEATAAVQVLMKVGMNKLLDGASDEARRVIMDAVTTGMDRELIINAIAHE